MSRQVKYVVSAYNLTAVVLVMAQLASITLTLCGTATALILDKAHADRLNVGSTDTRMWLAFIEANWVTFVVFVVISCLAVFALCIVLIFTLTTIHRLQSRSCGLTAKLAMGVLMLCNSAVSSSFRFLCVDFESLRDIASNYLHLLNVSGQPVMWKSPKPMADDLTFLASYEAYVNASADTPMNRLYLWPGHARDPTSLGWSTLAACAVCDSVSSLTSGASMGFQIISGITTVLTIQSLLRSAPLLEYGYTRMNALGDHASSLL